MQSHRTRDRQPKTRECGDCTINIIIICLSSWGRHAHVYLSDYQVCYKRSPSLWAAFCAVDAISPCECRCFRRFIVFWRTRTKKVLLRTRYEYCRITISCCLWTTPICLCNRINYEHNTEYSRSNLKTPCVFDVHHHKWNTSYTRTNESDVSRRFHRVEY